VSWRNWCALAPQALQATYGLPGNGVLQGKRRSRCHTEARTEGAMKPMSDAAWKQVVQRLDAAYSVGGRAALDKMTPLEAYVLYAEKMSDLRQAKARLEQYPNDELGELRTKKLEREVKDLCGWAKETNGFSVENEPDMER
jgi:hypothetical protein